MPHLKRTTRYLIDSEVIHLANAANRTSLLLFQTPVPGPNNLEAPSWYHLEVKFTLTRNK